MKTSLVCGAIAAALIIPTAASAQAVPAAVVGVVDLDRVTSECNACKTAQAAFKGQVTAYQTREKALAAPLQTEQKSLQSAVDALKGAEPDAALKARITAFQTKQQQGAQELAAQQQQLQRNQDYIRKQISDKLGPVYQQVMQRRGVNVLMEVGSTLATTQNVDLTNDVVAGLNTALPSIQTTAPAQAQQTQGR